MIALSWVSSFKNVLLSCFESSPTNQSGSSFIDLELKKTVCFYLLVSLQESHWIDVDPQDA